MKLMMMMFMMITNILAVNMHTYYNGNYTVYPKDYNNSSTVTVQLWGDNALSRGFFNTYGSAGGFIEAVVETNGNTTFNVRTGSLNNNKDRYYVLYDGFSSYVTTNEFQLEAGGGKWMQTVCESFGPCIVAFGGINVVSGNTNVTRNRNGTNRLNLNNGMVRFYY